MKLDECLPDWREGVTEFHSGRYWDAHERWERGWTRLPPPHREKVQIVIQVAGVIHLLTLGRIS